MEFRWTYFDENDKLIWIVAHAKTVTKARKKVMDDLSAQFRWRHTSQWDQDHEPSKSLRARYAAFAQQVIDAIADDPEPAERRVVIYQAED
jgi:hypothetical protein